MKRGFGSDNHSGVHPELLKALLECNPGHAPSYGTDEVSERALLQFQKHFGPQAQVFYVFNGTAGNALSLCAMIESFESILVSDISHFNMDECGAPEFFSGGKLQLIPSQHGKIHLQDLQRALIRRGDQHFSQARAVSLTQPTEVGTIYSLTELREISEWAHKNNLFVHIDGARLSNAARSLQLSFQEMITAVGVDIVSFGGTKNGFLFGEAIVILNPELARQFKYRRKQAAQLPSKTRFIAAQFERYLGTSLWKDIADHECQMAEMLHQALRHIPTVEITQPRQSNAVFVKIPQALIKKLREHFFFYVWDEKTFECRLMTSWDTQEEEIHQFTSLLKELQ